MTKNALPHIGEVFEYTGYVMHNCQMYGVIALKFKRIRADAGSGPTVHVESIEPAFGADVWGGWILPNAVKEQRFPMDVGPATEVSIDHPAWRRWLDKAPLS